jgi:hypothetical protein
MHAGSHAQVRVREPAGERILGETPTIGGPGADVVVPGAGAGTSVQIERRNGVWIAHAVGDIPVRVDGSPLDAPRDLQRHDVLAVGDAQIIVTDVSRTLLRIDVCHLVGNATVPPSGIVASLVLAGDGDEEVQIPARAALPLLSGTPPAERVPPSAGSRKLRARISVALIACLALGGLASRLVPVALDVEPGDAQVRVPGTLFAPHLQEQLLLFPGTHVVKAERKGYISAQTAVTVSRREPISVRLHLIKLPGTLQIDTGGVAATVSIDGVESGRAPGAIVAPAGEHTIAIRSPRYVDYIAAVRIEGALIHQDLKVVLQPSWGTLQISAIPAGAQISVDGTQAGKAPTVVDAPSGVRRVRIAAPGLKSWESSVVLKAGEALNIGPITLGQPDAHLVLRSDPGGAEVMIGGVFRGRTPLEADLPAGIQHEVAITRPGYAPWVRPVFAEPGRNLSLEAHLSIVGSRVSLEGDPDGAQILVDGVDRGRTPQTLLLSAVAHHIEVRKDGRVEFSTTVTPAPGLDRTLRYRLAYAEHSLAPGEVGTTLYSQTGYLLRLVPVAMGGSRTGTLERPFYVGVAEISNELFRRFHPDHPAAATAHAPGADGRPVTQVSWNEAAAFCNWLSEQDSLPPAYTKSQGSYALRQPVTIGYRLLTESEWASVARNASSLALHDLPGNLSYPGSPALGFRVVRYEE